MSRFKQFSIAIGLVFLILAPYAQADLPPLIPRQVLLGNPEKAYPAISPDGNWYAYAAPSPAGVLNIWLQDVDQTKPAILLTQDTKRPITNFFWAKDSKQILYAQDQNGDENFHVYSVDIASKKTRDLTPYPGVKASNLILNKDFPQQLLVGLNLRDRKVFDMYRVDLNTGKMTLDTKNPGDVNEWLADANFQIRAAVTDNIKDGGSTLRVRDNVNAPWRTLMTWPFGESGDALTINKDGKTIDITSTLNSDTEQLQKVDMQTGKVLQVLAQDKKSDVDDEIANENTREIDAVQFNYLKPEWKALNPDIQADLDFLKAANKGAFSISSRSINNNKWIITFYSDNKPTSYYLYERDKHQLKLLFVARPILQKYTLAQMQPIEIKSSDGLMLPAYLTLPVGVPAKNLPMVLNVHGGPWARDDWGYNPEVQLFANRGYAVLQVNYRGSTGFGKQFENAGNGEWGTGKMQQDLTDAVNWAVQQGIADPKKVCIYGGSYGGYATLAGLTFTPNLYACGVDLVGPTNIQTLFASIPPYWITGKKQMVLRVGDVEKDNALNQKISPFFHIDNIRVPLFIVQGLHDPRVNVSQAETIVKAMRAKKLPVTYVLYPDEGHGLTRPENRLDMYGRVEDFLAKYLGGRAEPWSVVQGSTAKAS